MAGGGRQAMELPRRVASELDLIMTRLLGKEPELHSAADRLRSEAEFRLAIVAPLAALEILFVVQWHALWTVFAPILVILCRDALAKRRAAGDLLADALVLGRVKAPALEKFAASVANV